MKTKTLMVVLVALLICCPYSRAGQKDDRLTGTTTGNVSAFVIESEHAADDLSRLGPDDYIVVFKPEVQDVPGLAHQLVTRHDGEIRFVYQYAIKGFAATLPPQAIEALSRHPLIDWIEPDQLYYTAGSQSDATWGLDRIDQRILPLDNTYHYNQTGAGVSVYIIDRGIHYSHEEFEGRAVFGFDASPGPGGDGSDPHGHGTHVAGTVGGKTYGVAKDVILVSVRVLGTGGSTYSNIIAGVDWVTANHEKPAVANMSLGGAASDALDTAVRGSVASGVTYVVAGLNMGDDACQWSPARVEEALTVGATRDTDEKWENSCYGPCVDLFAPGVSITSAVNTGDTATGVWTGTSMAAPHVAGVAALYLELHPEATPEEVFAAVTGATTKDIVTESPPGNNHLLYSLAWHDAPLSTAWEGTVSDNWHDAGNWSDGVPLEQSDAIISFFPESQPTITVPAEVGNLTLEDGATLLDNDNLTIHGEFVMERDIPHGGWRMISAPVGDMNIIGSDFVPENMEGIFDFYYFDESVDNTLPWISIKGNEETFDNEFVSGKGYLVAYDAYKGNDWPPNTFSFGGTMNTGDVTISLSYEHTWQWGGWNLIGNPYPSAIDWYNADHTLMEDNYAYVYDRTSDYEGYTEGYKPVYGGDPGAVIAANQGFFVKMENTGNHNFTFDNAMRVHGGEFTKEAPADDLLVLHLTGDGYFDRTTLRVREYACFGRDRSDALKLFSYNDAMPQLYSYTADGVKAAINTMPYVNKDAPVVLGMRISAEGEYMISLEETCGIYSAKSIIMEDIRAGTTHDLQTDPEYAFTADEGDLSGRFKLHFGKQDDDETGIDDTGTPAARIWHHNSTLYVDSSDPSTEVRLYDISGRQMYSFLAGQGEHQYRMNFPAGVYIVHISTQNSSHPMRIVVK